MRPPTEEEKQEMIIGFRDIYIPEVTKGKKTKWEELTFWEKRKVESKCEFHFKMILF